MFKYVRLLIVVALALTTLLPVLAQDDVDGGTDGNWCFEGEPWGDGRCNSDDDDFQNYMWLAGWCAYALEANLIDAETIGECLGEEEEEEVVVTEKEDDDDDKKKKAEEEEEESEGESEV